MGTITCVPCRIRCEDITKAKDGISTSQVLFKLRQSAADIASDGGQKRASLLVKSGGFAVKNFAVSNQGPVDEFYRQETCVGEGGFGTVRKAIHMATEVYRAIKTIAKSSGTADRLLEEVEIMRVCDHPHVVRVVESFQDYRNLYVVMELCEGGELFDKIVQCGTLSEITAANCVRQMLLAVNYLHQNHIIHRDLKPQNWLLASDQDLDKASLKLIDFGLSRRWQPGVCLTSKVGTPSYAAPELVSGKYTELVDVWSLGVICYALLSGELPFGGQTVSMVLKEIQQSTLNIQEGVWRQISTHAKELISLMLEKDPTRRPSAAEALRHEWSGIESDALRTTESNMNSDQMGRLKQFSRMNHLKKAAFTVVAMQLNEKKLDSLKHAFMDMDKNKDGTVSVGELRAGLVAGGVELPHDLDEMIEAADTDGSGVIDYTEFLAATLDRKHCHQENVLWIAFKKFDLDGSGAIDVRELKKLLGDGDVVEVMHLQEDNRLEHLFRQVDTNGDGKIDFEEFLVMVQAE